jgi:hypothetical protein
MVRGLGGSVLLSPVPSCNTQACEFEIIVSSRSIVPVTVRPRSQYPVQTLVDARVPIRRVSLT